jgi:hypothetical protein
MVEKGTNGCDKLSKKFPLLRNISNCFHSILKLLGCQVISEYDTQQIETTSFRLLKQLGASRLLVHIFQKQTFTKFRPLMYRIVHQELSCIVTDF